MNYNNFTTSERDVEELMHCVDAGEVLADEDLARVLEVDPERCPACGKRREFPSDLLDCDGFHDRQDHTADPPPDDPGTTADAASSTASITPWQRVRGYRAAGWEVTPVRPGEKGAFLDGWQHRRLTEAELQRYFDGPTAYNIGLLTGEPSNITDADIDCEEALRVADRVLPPTGAEFGRESKPRSHKLYVVVLPKSRKFEDPVPRPDNSDAEGRAMLLELRSTRLQTLGPGSTHPSGEAIEWEHGATVTPPRPASVSAEELDRKAALVATMALLGRYYPANGKRHDFDLALSGALLGSEVSEDETLSILQGAALAAGLAEETRRDAAVRDTAAKIAASEAITGWGRVAELLGEHGAVIVKTVKTWLDVRARGRGRGPSQATVLTEIGEEQSAVLFHDELGHAYAAITRGEHYETFRCASQAFRDWLTDQYMQRHQGAVPGKQALEEAVFALQARARLRGPERPVYVRIAERDGAIWIDLGDPNWRGVRITADRWTIESLPPGLFIRPKGMGVLPPPSAAGSIDRLRPYVNAGAGSDGAQRFALMVAWLVGALQPRGPYPIAVLTGSHGAAKSTTARVLRSVIDPHATPLLSPSETDVDVWIKAAHNLVLAFDNVSYLSDDQSDSHCRVATGGGYSKRLLYSDDDVHLFGGMRPQLFTGIGDIVARPDLLERSLILHLSRPERYQAEAALWARFTADHPAILGAICDAVSAALGNLPAVAIADPPRMVDFAHWIEAASPGLGWEPGAFLAQYRANLAEASSIALEGSPIGRAVQTFMASRQTWSGTATQLLEKIDPDWQELRARSWPRTPRAMSTALDRITPNLEAVGIVVTRARTGKERRITLSKEVPHANLAAGR